MYVVIFRAQIRQLDEYYTAMAAQLRQMALQEYGCTAFHASCESGQEIALSYWPDLASIQRWREASLHLEAKSMGRDSWYTAYSVDIARLERGYSFNVDA